ncbi:MAG: hypothetical protein ACXV3A_01045 [Kineosporiaceae bacterium]
MGFLVGGVDRHDVRPAPRSPQQLQVQLGEVPPGVLRPRLVEVVRQQLAAVQRECGGEGVVLFRGQRGRGA